MIHRGLLPLLPIISSIRKTKLINNPRYNLQARFTLHRNKKCNWKTCRSSQGNNTVWWEPNVQPEQKEELQPQNHRDGQFIMPLFPDGWGWITIKLANDSQELPPSELKSSSCSRSGGRIRKKSILQNDQLADGHSLQWVFYSTHHRLSSSSLSWQ